MRVQVVTKIRGFVLIEALVAVVVVALGLLGIARLQSLTLTSSSDTKTRAQAVALVESELEARRNQILRSAFDVSLADNLNVSSTSTVVGGNTSFTLLTTVGPVAGAPNARLVTVTVSWTDMLQGRIPVQATPVSGRTIVSWDDPALGRSLQTGNVGGGLPSNFTLKTPTGVAVRGDRSVQDCSGGQCSSTNDGITKIRTVNGVTQLLDASNRLIIYLAAKTDGSARQFTTIRGRVYLDVSASGQAPSPSDISVRLSSEGECIYNNADNEALEVCSGSPCTNANRLYKYYTYTCYVGEGWYGNVGLWNASNQTPKICVGDPTFNSGGSNGTLISPHPTESNTRSYRGFKASGSSFVSTGVQGGTHYGYVLTGNSSTDSQYTVARGAPVPSSYKPGSYSSLATNSDADRFSHHFLVTRNNQSCLSRMNLGMPDFSRNAGGYFCISPDDDAAADACPSIWPGFVGFTGGAGATNYRLTTTAALGGTVTSNPSGINCTSASSTGCASDFANNTTVALSAAPSLGYMFGGWSGACSGLGSCSTVMDQDRSVSASFVAGQAGQYQLGVTVSGNGAVSSSPAGMSCGSNSTCLVGFNSGSSVTLSATPVAGNTFAGWSGGGCAGLGVCTVTMDAAKSVTASFTSGVVTTYTLTVNRLGNGSGSITTTPAGINGCSSTTCSASFAVGTSVSVAASAASGSNFGGWGGACSGTGGCTVDMSSAKTVTATFHPNTCVTTISGSAKNGNGKFQITPTTSPTASSCTNASGNNLNYSCTLYHAGGTSVSIQEQSANGNTVYSTLNFSANCGTNSNVNFP